MRIGVISDSHGSMGQIDRCIEMMGQVDFIIHVGDLFQDGVRIAKITGMKVIGVVGNCDFLVQGPSEEVLSLGGRKVLITHGHLYKVKTGYSSLIARAERLRVDVVIFGHTHCPTILREKRILLYNPGSIQSARSEAGRTFGILNVEKNDLIPTIVKMDE